MLNLRQLRKTDSTQANSDALSRSSIEFRLGVPSDRLGNIGEPLDYGQSERLHENKSGARDASDQEQTSAGTECAEGPRRDEEDRASLDTAGVVARPSETHWDDVERESLHNSMPSAGPTGTRDDEIVDTAHASSADGANTSTINHSEEVRLCLSLHQRSCKFKVMFADAGDQSWG